MHGDDNLTRRFKYGKLGLSQIWKIYSMVVTINLSMSDNITKNRRDLNVTG